MANHCEVLDLSAEGKPGDAGYRVDGAKVRDTITGQEINIKATVVINVFLTSA